VTKSLGKWGPRRVISAGAEPKKREENKNQKHNYEKSKEKKQDLKSPKQSWFKKTMKGIGGFLASKFIFKSGKDEVITKYKSCNEIPVTGLKGEKY